MFETFVLQAPLDFPIFILKKELLKIPLFGWYLRKIGSIEIARETTTKDNSVVVQVFNNNDEKGIYYLYEVEGFKKRVYLKEYNEYKENLNQLSNKELEELDQQVLGYDMGPDEEIVFYEDLSPSELKKQIKEEKENKSQRNEKRRCYF